MGGGAPRGDARIDKVQSPEIYRDVDMPRCFTSSDEVEHSPLVIFSSTVKTPCFGY